MFLAGRAALIQRDAIEFANDRLRVINLLLEANANVNHADVINHDTPLMESAFGGDAALCGTLLSGRADIMQQNNDCLVASDVVDRDNLELAVYLANA